MRTYSEEYLTQVTGSARQFDFYVLVYGNTAEPDMLTADKIISINISRSSSDGIQLGACMSDRLSLRTLATTLFGGRGKKIEVFVQCTAPATEWVKTGTFYVDSLYTEHGMTTVKAYDNMSRMDKVVRWEDTSYAAAPVFPCSVQEVLEYVCARAKTSTDFQCQDFTVNKAPDGYTARELISYIAACHGGNARFSPDEVLQIRPYTQTSRTIDRNRCYSIDTAGDGGYTIKGILFDLGGDTKIFIDGDSNEYDPESDGVIECYNPFSSVAVAEYAWSMLGGMNYYSCSLEMPAEDILEPGDVFAIQNSQGETVNAVVMEQELSVSHNGGFVERISCTGEGKSNQRSANNRMANTESEVSEAAENASILNDPMGLVLKMEGGNIVISNPKTGQRMGFIGPFNGNTGSFQVNTPAVNIQMNSGQWSFSDNSGQSIKLAAVAAGMQIDIDNGAGSEQTVILSSGKTSAYAAGVYIDARDGNGMRRLKFADE